MVQGKTRGRKIKKTEGKRIGYGEKHFNGCIRKTVGRSQNSR
jgi:hypothetical protein